jgi:hypothetical protein
MTAGCGARTELRVAEAGALPDAVSTADAPPPEAACRRPTPIAWWRGEGDARDTAGGNDGTLVGRSGFTAGRVGQAFLFDGTDSGLEVAPRPGLRVAGALTASAWVRLDAPPGDFAPVLARWNDLGLDHRAYLLTVVRGGVLWWHLSADGGFATAIPTRGSEASARNAVVVSARPLAPGRFTHVAGVFDGVAGRAALWIDGREDGAIAVPFGALYDTPEPVLIGEATAGSVRRAFAAAAVDEVELYAEALGADDIRALAAGQRPACR